MRRAVFLLAAALAAAGCSKKDEGGARTTDAYVFPPVDVQRSFIAMMENPRAGNVLLVGEGAEKCAAFFEEAGVKSSVSEEGAFDLVMMDSKAMSKESFARVSALLADGGSLAWMIDVAGVKASQFKRMLKDFGMASARLWMVGEKHWLVTGSGKAVKRKLEDVLELFARERVFARLAEARCPAVHHLFAAYAGTRESIMPAFSQGDQNSEVRPEFFLTKEIPALDWIDPEGVDADIAKGFFGQTRSMQVVRRLAVEGSMLAEAGKEKEAIDAWSRAFARNPCDLFVLERLDRLDRNAKGFFEVRKILMAMKCYETMVLIDPDNQAALNNFGVCLKKIGRNDIAERAFRRVKELEARSTR